MFEGWGPQDKNSLHETHLENPSGVCFERDNDDESVYKSLGLTSIVPGSSGEIELLVKALVCDNAS